MIRPAKPAVVLEHEAVDMAHALFSPEKRAGNPIAALHAARELRELIDLLTIDAVRRARKGFATWADIGDALSVTKQAAHQQYGTLVELPPPPHG